MKKHYNFKRYKIKVNKLLAATLLDKCNKLIINKFDSGCLQVVLDIDILLDELIRLRKEHKQNKQNKQTLNLTKKEQQKIDKTYETDVKTKKGKNKNEKVTIG